MIQKQNQKIIIMERNITKSNKNKVINNLSLWRKSSNYSAFICLIVFVLLNFFEEFTLNIIRPVYYIGITAVFIFLLSELMKYLLKKKQNG